MTIEILWPAYTLPANSSRFFGTREAALDQPTGAMQLGWDSEDPFLFNTAFNASLIYHDDSYCTSVVDLDQIIQIPTLDYVDQVVQYLSADPTIADIGCGTTPCGGSG